MSRPSDCPICERPITNPPAWIDLPGGARSVMVHEHCAPKGLTEAQVEALRGAQR